MSDGEGVLVFEQPGGGPDAVPASRVAQVLAMGQVPVVVLNACQSGAVGKDLEAAVATRLLRHGIASVVAMAYSVYAVAAADFMAAFYERLFAGHTVTAAVTAGRQRLFQRNMRPSPKGDMPLADWVVPVHYLHRDVSFPQARTERGAKASLDEELDRMRGPGSGDGDALDLDPVGSFVGRDDLFYQLEVAAQQQKVVVLYGPGGTGKTELAKAFGRWWRDTRGVEQPDWVIWHSFEPGVASHGLDGVIMEIGLRVFGSDFASLARRERRAAAQQVLEEWRLLLIWDNFETVRSMPAPGGAARPLGEAGREELREFLGQLTLRGRSAAVITSRTREGWLGDACRITVGRLATQEAAEYAGDLLTAYPAAGPRRARRAFGELMEWLDGHPLSMRLILSHLDTTEPEILLDGLRGIAPLPDSDRAEEGRSTSLPASITYSFIHLTDATRRLLPAVCLFQGVAAAMVLAAFSETPEVPARFRGATIQEWIASLEDAARVGLLAPLGLGMYQIHPALPAYLAAQWRCEEPEGHDSIRDAATRALLSAHASFGAWLEQEFRSGDAAMAVKTLDMQRYTFGRLFGFALDRQLWDEAHAIARPLILAWDARGRAEEVEAWADRVRYATEGAGENIPALDSPEGQLWLFVTGIQANHLATFRPKDAERIYRQQLEMLQAQPASIPQQTQLGTAYHQLGIVAQRQGQLDEAKDLFRKAITIKEELGNKPGTATGYLQLGIIAKDQGRLGDAEDLVGRALAVNREFANRSGTAAAYHQLGIVAQLRGRLDDAESLFAKALAINGELGNKPAMAASYHQLGIIAQARGRLGKAEDWYLRALLINEELRNKPLIALSYEQLGRVAMDRGRLDPAKAWYSKALALKEELGDRPGTADVCLLLGVIAEHQDRLNDTEAWYRRSLTTSNELADRSRTARAFGRLGLLAEVKGELPRALECLVKCVTLFEEFPHPDTGPDHLARLTAQLGIDALDNCWHQVTGNALPQAVRDYVASRRP